MFARNDINQNVLSGDYRSFINYKEGFMEIFRNVMLAAGGLGLLLYGIKMMSSGLEVVAGDSLQVFLKKATSNRFLAALVGVVTTIIISSSTAVSVIIVGFVNAGLMNLQQAIGVLLGVNVGTTFSSQLIAFGIDQYAPIFIVIGVVMYLFFKKSIYKNIGYAVLGFGILFFSISVMSDALRVFRDNPLFLEMIEAIANPFLALLIGFSITIIIQSSSATMGLLVTLHLNDVPIPFLTSAFIIFGANIGTSVTAVLVSFSAGRESRRSAFFHITYDIIGSIFFGSLVLLVPAVLNWFQTTWYDDSARQVAMFHTFYNVATLMLLIPFVPYLAKLMQFLIPVKEDEAKAVHERKLMYLESTSKSPTLDVVNAQMEINRMGVIAIENMSLALESFFEKSAPKAAKVFENEKTINFLNRQISSKLVDINKLSLSASDAKKIGKMFGVLIDVERIGDHAYNIAEYTVSTEESGIKFSDKALEELRILGDITIRLIQKSLDTFRTLDNTELKSVKKLEKRIDNLSKEFTDNHVERLKLEDCEPISGVIFLDMINDLERSADHAENITLAFFPKKRKNL